MSLAIRAKMLMIYLILGFYTFLTIGAFIWVALQSLKANSEFITSLPWQLPQTWKWSNFVEAWQRAKMGSYFGNSIVISFISTTLSLIVATLASYALSRIRGVKWAGFLQQFFLVGIMLPVILAVVPLYFLWVNLHLVNTKIGLIIIYTGLMLPFSIYYLSGFFKSIPHELEEAAAVDGAPLLLSFIKIFLPMAGPGIAAVFVVNFLWAWNEFFYALVFITRSVNYTVAVGLYYLDVNAEVTAQWVYLFAGMLIALLPVLILYMLLSDQIAKGLTAGALKG
ncbi:N-acetylglucosamine transport system permease protein [Paenibacillus sp. yr247]|uniref:carbohydrate ABC transporter permease n=1 Tax=Paenibacillus sp. yr247 TaxID=1761880 RepID=UPI00088B717E|nr:carbohydrate ABC transporter permease [Paenibacillus sp. yr247]SDO38381.1 N-acetylglucosamine transport system permease protein [Paenibacillus sp. yr247]